MNEESKPKGCPLAAALSERLQPLDQTEIKRMFGHNSIVSISEINRIYPDEWVAITVEETDADGFALRGQILSHSEDERIVWTAVKLGDIEDPVYVFHTGRKKAA